MTTNFDSLYSAIPGAFDALGASGEDATTESAPADTPASDDATPPAGEEPAASQGQQGEPVQPVAAEATDPTSPGGDTGPGDHAKAFAQYRSEITGLKNTNADLQARLDRYDAWFEQQRQEQQRQELAEQFEQYADDPQALAQLFQQQQAQQQQAFQSQQNQRASQAHVIQSVQLLKSVPGYEDYDTQIAKVVTALGQPAAEALAAQQQNPALWAYQLGKSMVTPEELASQANEAAARLQAGATPKPPVNSRGISRLPAAAPSVDASPSEQAVKAMKAMNFGPGDGAYWSAYAAALGG